MKRVRVKFEKTTRTIGREEVTMHIARCLEDGHTATGDSQAEAARDFAQHLSHKHPNQQVKKV